MIFEDSLPAHPGELSGRQDFGMSLLHSAASEHPVGGIGRDGPGDILDALHPRAGLGSPGDTGGSLMTSAATSTPPDIVVIGTRAYQGTCGYYPEGGGGSGGTTPRNVDENGGAGGGDPPMYETPGVSPDANAFADEHAHNKGTTQADEHAYEILHDALAKLYDWAQANPNALIDIGNGLHITASEALWDISHITYNISDGNAGPHGDETILTYNVSGGFAIAAVSTLNPSAWYAASTGNAAAGDAGLNFTIFHELGHSLNGFEYGQYNAADEQAANTAGYSLETYLGIPTISAPGGYD